MDALEFLAADARTYDVVFLDPPYAMRERSRFLDAVRGRLAPGALVYLESGQPLQAPPGWQILRQARAGAAHCQLLRIAS